MLLFETTRLSIFKKISSLPVFAPTQMKKFPLYLLLSEPTSLLNSFIRASYCITDLRVCTIISNLTKSNKVI
jgi:hypothetical protein